MRAIILAAGRGSRLNEMTDDKPKCLTLLKGIPLIEWQMSSLNDAGIHQICIVRGYHALKINMPGVTFFENKRWQETNMVRTLSCAADWLRGDTCIVCYSDIIYSSNTIKTVMNQGGDICIPYYTEWLNLWKERFSDPLSDAETFRFDSHQRLTEIGNRATRLEEIKGQFMGILLFTPNGWKAVENELNTLDSHTYDKMDSTKLLNRLIPKIEIRTVPITDPWFEIDSQNDLQVTETYFMV